MQHKDRLSDEERIARRRETTRKYREKNREKLREEGRERAAKLREDPVFLEKQKIYKKDPGYIERQRQYRAENRDSLNAKTVAWQAANKEKFEAYQKSYLAANRGAAKERARLWRIKHPERSHAQGKAWRQSNKHMLVIKEQRRRARIKGVGGNLSKDIHARLMKLQKGKCAVCRTSLKRTRPHIDHHMPIAKGGTNTDDNVQLLCPHCNAKKSAKHPVDFMQERGFLC